MSDSGTLPDAEAGNARHLLISLGDAAEGLRDFVRRNLDVDFSSALRVQRGAVLMAFVVVHMVVAFVGVLFGSVVSSSLLNSTCCLPNLLVRNSFSCVRYMRNSTFEMGVSGTISTGHSNSKMP